MKNFLIILAGACLAVWACGCLTVEKKVYRIHLNADGKSGSETITFVNILSQKEDTVADKAAEDFDTLIAKYVNGSELESEDSGVSNFHKRLYEQDGKLYGEASFTFDSLSQIGMYRYGKSGPLMLLLGGIFNIITSESYAGSNGTFGGERMPLVFWDGNRRDLTVTTNVAKTIENTVPLLAHYTEWKKTH